MGLCVYVFASIKLQSQLIRRLIWRFFSSPAKNMITINNNNWHLVSSFTTQRLLSLISVFRFSTLAADHNHETLAI